MKHVIVAFCCLYLIVSFSCGSPASENKTDKLISVQWYLISLNGKTIDKKSPDFEIPYVNFSEEKRFKGFTGCNNFTGNYKYENGKLALDPGAITKMHCGDNIEIEFLDAIKKVSAFETKDNNLLLLNGSQEIMIFTHKK